MYVRAISLTLRSTLKRLLLSLLSEHLNIDTSIHATMTRLSPGEKLVIVICLSFAFFVAEIAFGFRTSSLALIADAFHYLSDIISFIVALTALILSRSKEAPASLAFGWQRVRVLGAFSNGVFLLALGLSIFLQSIERFCRVQGELWTRTRLYRDSLTSLSYREASRCPDRRMCWTCPKSCVCCARSR